MDAFMSPAKRKAEINKRTMVIINAMHLMQKGLLDYNKYSKYTRIMNEPRLLACPECDGDGIWLYRDYYVSQGGEPYEEMRHCETCDGSGEMMLEDD